MNASEGRKVRSARQIGEEGDGEMRARKIIGVSILAFLLPFAFQTIKKWWQWERELTMETESSCDYQLKALWLLSRRVSQIYRLPFPPPFSVVKEYAGKRQSILMTRQISEYLFGVGKLEGAYWTFDLILICRRDPDYLLKAAKYVQHLPYEPSYRWFPDARTLAECPYCRLAISLDGKLIER